MTRSTAVLVLTALLAGAAGAGCSHGDFTSAERYDRGLVVCLSGAGGMTGECSRIRNGLDEGGVTAAIEIFDWSSGHVIDDQTDVSINHGRALDLAARLESYMAQYPGRPVHLVALSAGTGIAIWALEDLSGSQKITGVVLMASSLDARYDLTPALLRVRDRLYSFHTVTDAVLGLGVTMAGTVDREGAVAGGFVGFKPPADASELTRTLYKEKLSQIPWLPTDVIYFNMGDHLGTSSTLFVRARVAPLVMGKDATATQPPATTTATTTDTPRAAKTDQAAVGKAKASGQFIGWSVGDAAAARTARPEESARPVAEESQLFKKPGDLP